MTDTGSRAFAVVRDAVFEFSGAGDSFNPYADRRADRDRSNAADIRRNNLLRYFEACRPDPDLFLLAEAPGPWGCGFSGVPITSEAQLLDPAFPLSGDQASNGEEPLREYSAGIFWRLLADSFPRFVVWNACPVHPFRPGDPYSIRAPRKSELRRFAPVTRDLIGIFSPRRVLAVGRKAEGVLAELAVPATYVRHPSQGGATAFREGIRTALAEDNLPEAP